MAAFYASEQVDCGGEAFTLVIDISAIDAFERRAGTGLIAALERMGGAEVRLGEMSWLVWALLRAKHPAATLDRSFMLISEYGETLTPAILALVEQAFPKAAEKAKDENPPKPRRGTGKSS